jgi:uncharacterized protein (UPF0261 family)
VPERYAGRTRHAHNSEITLVRTSAAESAELGRRLAERVSEPPAGELAGGGVDQLAGQRQVILLPSGGLSAIDAEGHPFHDADADAALAAAVRASADPARVRVVDVAGNIDRAEVGSLAANLLHELISTRSGGPPCTP